MSGEVEALLDRMAGELERDLAARGIAGPLMIGIHTGGVWVAEGLHRRLGLSEPLGTLDISFYRDDFSRIGIHPQVHPSRLPVPVDDRHVVLVDDVLFSGRTVRAALNEIFDFGRPSSVTLAVLVDRGGRELPIEARVVGKRLDCQSGCRIKLRGPKPLRLAVEPECVEKGT